MSIVLIIKIIAILLAIGVISWLCFKPATIEHLSVKGKMVTGFTGFIANFFDTFGIGSFASIIALRKAFHLMPDDVKLIGTLNIQAVLPTLVQSLLFLHFVNVDLTTLLVSAFMITLGGLLSGFIAVNMNKHLVRKIMLIAFIATGIVLLLSQLGLLPLNGLSNGLSGYKLALFGLLMLGCGFLPAFGVGYYSLVQICIVLFSVNPIIAFPIMTTACSLQMPITTIPFILKQKFYKKSTIWLMLTGALGVLLAVPLITHINSYYLKWFLVIIIAYNIFSLRKSIH